MIELVVLLYEKGGISLSIIRHAVMAGKFYSQNPRQLKADVQRMLDDAEGARCDPKILIVPHAGYVFSGPVAASAFATLKSRRASTRRVVILGTCHVRGVTTIVTTGVDSFETPLGFVETDADSIQSAVRRGLACVDDRAQNVDHAIEVQLPFLQLTLDSFQLAPFLVGDVPVEQVAELIRLLWGGEETIFVISSDLSHYLSYDQAKKVDQETSEDILNFNDKKLDLGRACGFRAIAGAILAARESSMHWLELDLRNSGDTAGSTDRVVGYGAFALCASSPPGE